MSAPNDQPSQHFVEAYIDRDQVSTRLVCSDPPNCQETTASQRIKFGADYCNVREWVDAESINDLLHYPAGVQTALGRTEVRITWTSSNDQGYPILVPPENQMALLWINVGRCESVAELGKMRCWLGKGHKGHHWHDGDVWT